MLAWQPPHPRDPSSARTVPSHSSSAIGEWALSRGCIAAERKLSRMNEEHTESPSRVQSLGRHALAALVLLVCAWLLLHILFHVVVVVATIIAVVVAIIGAVWAIRVLF